MSSLSVTPRTQPRRRDRTGGERAVLHAVLDEGRVATVAFVLDEQPFAMPMGYGRYGEQLYLHGSTASRIMRVLASGAALCVTVTLLDGLVLARSALHHSMNYRSAVVLGRGSPLTEPAAKLHALRVITEHLSPRSWDAVRAPSRKELAATAVIAVALDEASVKLRTGPPIDDEADYTLDVWAGVVPLAVTAGEPIADPRLRPGIAFSVTP